MSVNSGDDEEYPRLVAGAGLVGELDSTAYLGFPSELLLRVKGRTGGLARWLEGIDGQRTLSAQLLAAAANGIAEEDARMLLERMRQAGMVVNAGRPGRQLSPLRVALVGDEAATAKMARWLERDGASIDQSTLASSRLDQKRQAIAATACDLVIVVFQRFAFNSVELGFVELLSTHDIPHLVVAAGPVGRVGPLVIPGITPCLRCEDLTRADICADWPVLSQRQAASWWSGWMPPKLAELEIESMCVRVAGRLRTLEALNWRYRPVAQVLAETAGKVTELEVAPVDGAIKRYRPARHYKCGCWWQSLSATAG